MENLKLEGSETTNQKKTIDIHIHIGGKGNSSPCYMSTKFLVSPAYLYMVTKSGIPLDEILKDHDGALRDTLVKRLNDAPSIDFGVLLAFDAVYKNGEIDQENTHMITPNNYVSKIARENKKILFGASVNPNKGEVKGTKELEECIENSAVLIKWIPNSQRIDPADERHDWFYKILEKENIPLLCHTGIEHAVPVANRDDQKLGNPKRLERALEKGVTVIAAHCSVAGFPWENDYIKELKDMMKNPDWKLYADISAMCSLFRISSIDDVQESIPFSKMVMGSDYPIPVETMPPGLVKTLDIEEYLKISKIDNPFEKNYQQLLAMGFPKEATTIASNLNFLRIPEEKLRG